MPLRKYLAAGLGEFDKLLKEALLASASNGGKVFVLFTGEAGADGASWCPDCEDCKPLVKSVFEEAGGAGDVSLIEVPLVRSEYRGNTEHWARKHGSVKLTKIPTLIKWGKVNKVAECVEGECSDATRVRELVLDE